VSTLNQSQIAGALSQAGFNIVEVPIAYAIIMAESGGNPNAHNSTPPDDSYGLAQINMYGSLGPTRRKQFGITNNSELYNPATNLRAMHMIYKSSGWGAWHTYNSGAYKKFMTSDPSGIQQIANVTGVSAVGDFLGSVGDKLDVGKAITAVGSKLFTGIADLIGIFVALTLLVVGVLILARKSVDKVSGTAASVAKVAAL